jgi:cytochrome b6-f complex iron-sulfur subunit
MERRKFIKTCCGVALSAPLVGVLDSCTSVHYAMSIYSSRGFIVKKSDFIFLKNDKEKKRDFVFVKQSEQDFPICVFRTGEESFVVSLMYCPHQGCENNVQGVRYVCPCHGSEFSTTGKVLVGPSDKDLKTFKTTTDNENIYIQLV